jgi:hypothetical protein
MKLISQSLTTTATIGLLLLGAPLAAGRAQRPTSHATELAALRRQPKDLLYAIALTKAEKKAVYGIVRRNAKAIRALEVRDHAALTAGVPDARLEEDLLALRDRERAELRAVLTEAQRKRFDRNLTTRAVAHVAHAGKPHTVGSDSTR